MKAIWAWIAGIATVFFVQKAYAQSVAVSVTPVRLLVLNRKGSIIAIYSNARTDPYALKARVNHTHGQDVTINDAIQKQYLKLAAKINWQKTGKVYP